MSDTAAHYTALFGGDPSPGELRESYALHDDAIPDRARLDKLSDFFFWTAWACDDRAPGATYTLHEQLAARAARRQRADRGERRVVDAQHRRCCSPASAPSSGTTRAFKKRKIDPTPPARDPLDGLALTPSMRASEVLAGVVIALFVVQVVLGA
jgi:nitric oxide reductase subunit B